ncbi:MAG: hypothetical protein U0350_21315 [Caldilineaceae bacterium]
MQVQTLRFIPSPLATPAPLQPITITQPAQLPAMTHDLLFANAQGLMRWRHAARRIDQLLAWKNPEQAIEGWPSVRFVLSADGKKALVANKSVVNQTNHFTLQLYDLKTEKITTLLTDTTSVLSIALAPDTSWIAYSLLAKQESQSRPWWQTLLTSGSCQCGGDTVNGAIYAMRVQPPYQPIRLSDCSEFAPQENCFDLQVWSAEQIHWATRLRMPIIAYTKDTATLASVPVLQSSLDVSSAWFAQRSPMDRYIPIWVTRRPMRQDGPHEENSDGILDTQTAHIAELPGAMERERRNNRLAWLHDGRLAVVRPAVRSERYSAIELWSLNSAREGLLKLDQLLRLPISATNYPGQPVQLADGQLAFALFNTNPANDFERGLFLLDLRQYTLRKLNRLPASIPNELHPAGEPQPAAILWSPDGAGAIFYGYNQPLPNTLLYIPADGSPPYGLYPIVGAQAWGFTWLPE